MYRASHWVLTAVVIAAAVTPARAESDVDAARAAAERGRREYNLGHWQQSIEGFEKAYQLSGDAAFLFNLGQANRQLGHNGEALRLYRTYLREKPDAPNRDVTEKQIKELEAQESHAPAAAKPAPPPTQPSAAAPASKAPVAPTQPAPAPAASKPAPAPTQPAPTTTAAKPTPAPTQPAPASAASKPAPAPTQPAPAPTAAKPTPAPTQPAPPPTAVATAPPPTGAAPGAIVVAPATPPPALATPLPRWLPLVGAALTIASAAGATVAGLQSSSRYDDLKATCGATAAGCTPDQIDGVRSRDRTATILWVTAGVLAAATGVAVVVNTHAAGVSALWRF